jgi:hypothetical protein
MRFTFLLTLVAALALGITVNLGLAQDQPEQPLLEEAPSESELQSPSPAPTAEAAGNITTAYEEQKEASKGWKLPEPNFLKEHGFELGGWLEQGLTYSNHPDAFFNGPVFTNDWNGEYQMNQFWMFLDRAAKNNGEGWAWGAHLDMMYGTDWRFGIVHGIEDRINDFNRQSYGMVIPQFYFDVAYNDLTIRLGHFSAIPGYEVVAAPPNPFYSHSYAMVFSEPILVTGILADYKLSEQLSVLGCIHRGWMMFEDENNIWDFWGGVRWTAQDKKTSIGYTVNVGPEDPEGIQQRFVGTLVFKHQVTDRLQYVLQHDLGQEQNGVTVGQSAQWYGIDQYFLYKLNDRWSANLRAEWFRDNNGVRVQGAPPDAGLRVWPASPGFAGNFYEVTAGLNWRPNGNILFRPEIRWDWYNGSLNNQGQLPFNNGQSSSQVLAAADLIFSF